MTIATPSAVADCVDTGLTPGSGTFSCLNCGAQLSLHETDALPECPRCHGSSFRRDSIFEALQGQDGATSEFQAPPPPMPTDWLAEAREMLSGAGPHLACREGEEIQIFPIAPGWTRIGRSAAADIRLDDPSVSRRHALIVREDPHTLRVLDDRSLNGVLLNTRVIESSALNDGDELMVGRYRLIVLEA